MMSRNNLLISILLFALFFGTILALHAPAFDAPLYYDSAARLQEQSHLFQGGLQSALSIFPQRPAAMFTFYLNHVCGGMNPYYFRLVNAALLAVAALLVVRVIVTTLLLRHNGHGISWEKWVIASLLGMFFAVHPVQVLLVDYIWQRTALLACVFYLLSFLFYLATRTGRIRNRYIGYTICVLMFLPSLASKENAVTLPVVFILAEAAFFKQNIVTLCKRAVVWLGQGAIAVGILSLLESPHGLGKTSGILDTISTYYAGSGVTLLQVALTQCRMVVSYFLLIAFPKYDIVHLISPQIISNSVIDPPITLLAGMGFAALIVLSLFLLKRRPASGFGLCFFLLNLLPESFLVPQYLFVPYRAFLPMVGILIVAGDLISWLVEITASRLRKLVLGAVAVAFLPILVLTASVTAAKARVWQDPIALWKEELERLPLDSPNLEPHGTAQILSSLAVALQNERRYDEAIVLLEEALKVTPRDTRILTWLANANAGNGDFRSATTYLERALRAEPDSADVHWTIGNVAMMKGTPNEALAHYKTAVARGKGAPEFDDSLGSCYFRLGNYEEAVRSYRRALERDPSQVETRYRLGKALMKAHRTSDAEDQLLRVIKAKPSHWKAHNDMGVLLARSGRPDLAAAHFDAALKINPSDESIRKNLENALAGLKKTPPEGGRGKSADGNRGAP